MRYLLIFIGAAVVAYLLAKGIRAFMAERRAPQPSQDETQPAAKRPPYRIR